jgi:hypothetical protein
MASIITSADCDAIRSRGGAQAQDLSDDDLISHAYVFEVERELYYQISKQAGVASVATIMAKPYSPDAMNLKEAGIALLIAKFYDAATNALNTSVTTGDQNVDRGGIGAQWKDAKEESLKEAFRCLRRITGWQQWRTI